MTHGGSHRLGVVLMTGATLCWASAGILVRTLHLKDAWEVTFWRSFFMTLFIGTVLLVQYRGRFLDRLRATGVAGVTSGALWALMYVCFIVALSKTTVANTLVLCSVSPFMSALFGWLFLRERVAGRTWAAMVVAMSGIVLMFSEGVARGDLAGNLVALLIPVGFGLNVVLNRRMHATVDMVPTLFLSGIFSCLVVLPFALPFDARGADFVNLVTLGVVQLGGGCLLMVLAARHLRAAEVGLLSELETVFGVAATWWVVGEVPSDLTLAGGVIVIAALAVDTALSLMRRPVVPAPAS
ncbi:MAG: EamA family transporter [Betaproteobacteria bacterium]|nr:EamA family transporter [Betaproteobacteria bacterium]